MTLERRKLQKISREKNSEETSEGEPKILSKKIQNDLNVWQKNSRTERERERARV